MSTPNPSGGGGLDGVSCTSASACTAVGSGGTAAGPVTLAERWNGKTWAIQATPTPKGARETPLYGVSCASAWACTAVGFYYNGSASPILAEHWNGKTWRIQATPTGPQGAAFAVSCTSASACTAVGYNAETGPAMTLAERWNGTTWAVQKTPNPPGGGYLTGVSCTSAWACTAVGYYYNNSGNAVTLAERWNGKTWAIQSIPTISADSVTLRGVSCTSASACTAVGTYATLAGDNPPGTVAERWNGKTWAMQSIPDPSGSQDSELDGVSCASASACTAVGAYGTSFGGTGLTLAEHWNGTAWAVQATPNPSGATGSALGGVSCTSASACIAAGAGPRGTLAERYGLSS